ncbi:MAG: hypothetical protein ACI4F6_03405 [Acutalibacteraceae bacterium]
MYIIKNALKSITRNKLRNILIGIIVLVIAISACVALSIRQAAETTKADTLYYYYLGVLHGTDLYENFIGDPTTSTGTVCGTGAILTAANDYLSDVDASMIAKDISGYSPEDLYELIDNDTPVAVLFINEKLLVG